MKCPKCGNEIIDGHLICELCGEEIQIVPDFEPEIESRITETLSTLVGIGEADSDKSTEDDVVGTDHASQEEHVENNPKKPKKIKIPISAILAFVFTVFIAIYGIYMYQIHTVDYQVKKAKQCAAAQDYDMAIEYLEKAFAHVAKDDAATVLFLEAEYYSLKGDTVSALQQLLKMLDENLCPEDQMEILYSKIIGIYADAEQYEEINELLLDCPNKVFDGKAGEIVNMFQSYMAKEPEFSYEEGSYEEIIPLKLSSNTSGKIYYTVDGTLPDENSMIYTAPIFMETGDYTISAVFVNDYGIKSKIVTKNYRINLAVPAAPEVTLYSGEYSQPVMIEAEVSDDGTLYYSTDESEPTADSVPYTGPIPMPLGKTVFKFVNISKDGLSSEVVMRTYTLTLSGAIPTSKAVSGLINKLVEVGYLEDTTGKTAERTERLSYQFSSVLRIQDGHNYFTINEYSDDGTGVLTRTDKVFLVEVYSGEPARLGYDDDGNFVAVPL